MSDKSAIEWLNGGSTWNPVRGCTPCAPECANCYARAFAERWRGIPGHPYEQGFDPRTVPEALDLPLRWKKPRTIFVNSMSDLFHEAFDVTYIADVFATMGLAWWHSFILLTKRAQRTFLLADDGFWELVNERIDLALEDEDSPVGPGRGWNGLERRSDDARATAPDPNPSEPLPNVTVGVSVGTRARVGDIEILRGIPAARRMVSFEPLLEDLGDVDLRGIDFAAIGGESGPKARLCNVAWIRSLVKRCRAAGCAPFVKQLGAHVEDRNDAGFDGDTPTSWPMDTDVEHDESDTGYQGAPVRVRLRDRKGGDPAEWPADLRVREFPEPR